MALQFHTGLAQKRHSSGVAAGRDVEPPSSGSRLPLVQSMAEAAADADVAAPPAVDLAELWQDVMDRRFNMYVAADGDGRLRAILRSQADPSSPRGPLTRIETAVLVRVLCGAQQKFVAYELDIAPATTSRWYWEALAKLHFESSPVPAPLVVAAQSWAAGQKPAVDVRWSAFEAEGRELFLLSMPKPNVPADAGLTPAEREIASLLIEGESQSEIASRRGRAAQTIACQLRAIYSKLQLTGRYALIGRAAELGWFREAP
jgi:DNA-binding NarL/FixJ family response regulator